MSKDTDEDLRRGRIPDAIAEGIMAERGVIVL